MELTFRAWDGGETSRGCSSEHYRSLLWLRDCHRLYVERTATRPGAGVHLASSRAPEQPPLAVGRHPSHGRLPTFALAEVRFYVGVLVQPYKALDVALSAGYSGGVHRDCGGGSRRRTDARVAAVGNDGKWGLEFRVYRI